MNWKNIISHLSDSGLTQAEIAKAVGCSQTTISELYRIDEHDPRSSVGFALVALLKKRGIRVEAAA